MRKFTLMFIAVLAALILTGCPEPDSGQDPVTYAIGDTGPSGVGIVFYITTDGLHGLEASLGDQSTGIRWHNGTNIVTGATATAIGSGSANTSTIITIQGDGDVDSYAAELCDDQALNGYDEWFLPSKDELNLMYEHKDIIGGFSTSDYYWSSSEINVGQSWVQGIGDGTQTASNKGNDTAFVRAVRAFQTGDGVVGNYQLTGY